MNRKKKLKLLLACILLFMSALIGYKIYLLVYEADYYALNADHIDQIESRLPILDNFRTLHLRFENTINTKN